MQLAIRDGVAEFIRVCMAAGLHACMHGCRPACVMMTACRDRAPVEKACTDLD